MIGYNSCAIVALVLSYFHSTNAATKYSDNVAQILDHLFEEKKFLGSLTKTLIRTLSFGRRKDIVCDVLNQNEKQFLCDKIIQRMIEHSYGNVFVTTLETDDEPFAVPEIVDLNNPYLCHKLLIDYVGMEKRMFWCKSRVVIKEGPESPHRFPVEGFFCAGSRETKGRVFVFQPTVPNGQNVFPVGEVDNFGLIIEKATGKPSIDDSSSASSASSSSELF